MGKFLNLLAHLFFAVLALALFLLVLALSIAAVRGSMPAALSLAVMALAVVSVVEVGRRVA